MIYYNAKMMLLPETKFEGSHDLTNEKSIVRAKLD